MDDTKCIQQIRNEEDVELLQVSLDQLYKWQEENNMKFNGDKFQVLRLGKHQDLKDYTWLFTSEMDPISQVEEAKDLGIQMDDGGKFKTQRLAAITKTRNKASWVLRVFRSRNASFLKKLWRSLIQPHQDYCSQLWFPVGQIGEIREQEVPLRAFTKRVKGLYNIPYWDRLKALKLSSTERRVERYRIIYTWKILQGLVPNCGISGSPFSGKGRLAAIPNCRSGRLESIKTLKENSFTSEGPKLFNALPRCIRDCTGSKESFKTLLDSFLELIPDQPLGKASEKPGAFNNSNQPTNSVRFWIRSLSLNNWSKATVNASPLGQIP